MLDPECADITARILELLGYEGWSPEHPRFARRWTTSASSRKRTAHGMAAGCELHLRHVAGVARLRAMNLDMHQPWLLKARTWLESVQHKDGGWGERCNTYDDPVFKGAAQHRVANRLGRHGLCAFDDPDNPALKRGIEYLIRKQNPDGSWTKKKSPAPFSEGFSI